jgi:hypothetical protein
MLADTTQGTWFMTALVASTRSSTGVQSTLGLDVKHLDERSRPSLARLHEGGRPRSGKAAGAGIVVLSR